MKYLILCSFITLLSFKSFGTVDIVAKADNFLNEAEYDSAIYYFDIAIYNCKNTSNDTSLAALYVQKGKTLKLNEEFELALIDYKSALNLYKKCNNVDGMLITLIHLAEFYRSIHKFEKAFSYIDEAKELIDYPTVTINNRAYFYNRYAAILTEGSLDRQLPIKYSKMAILLAKQCGNKDIEASSLNELAFIYKEGDPSIAIEYYFNALQIYKEINSKRYVASILVNIARTYHDIDDFKNSIEYCNQGLLIAENTEWNMIKRDLYYYLYRSYEGLKDYKKAMEALNECSIYAELIIKSERNQALFELETQYDLENKNNQILLEQEKTKASNKEIEDKKHEIKLILLIVILLCVILVISFTAFYQSRKSNVLLNKTIRQKEILLQEVHHRVKNNMTLLNSLLFLRGEASENPMVIEVLDECQARVQTMSLVHQNLYDVDDASKVDFKKFIEELIVESTSIIDCFDKKIETEINTNNLFLEMGSAVFLGLILNELITNSLKYAFNEDKTHSISVGLSKVKSKYTLTYSDSGPGLPKSFDLKNTSGFGFQLINIMVSQIDGKLEYESESNLYSVTFKL